MAAPLMSLNLNSPTGPATSTTAGPARPDAAQGDAGPQGGLFARLMQARTAPADAALPTLDGAAATPAVTEAALAAEAGAATDAPVAMPADMAQWLAQLGLMLPGAPPPAGLAGERGLPGLAAGPADAGLDAAAASASPLDPAVLAAGLPAGRGLLPGQTGAVPAGAAREPGDNLAVPRLGADELPATRTAGAATRFRLDPSGAAVATAPTANAQAPATPVVTAAAVTPVAAPGGAPEALAQHLGRDAREMRESGSDLSVPGLHNGSAVLSSAALAPAPALGAPAVTAAPVVNLPIALPVSDPAFGAVVMTRVAGLAGQGVQQAQLHLNPAEMGPIVIRIAVEQGQAQVDFQAAHAATRELLEGSLPALAQAFQDDGLQLVASRVEALPEARADGSATSPGWSGDTGQPSAGSGQPREQPAAAGQFRGSATAARNGAVGGADAVAAGGAGPHGGPAGRLDLYA